MQISKAIVASNEQVSDGYHLLVMTYNSGFIKPEPGQFLTMRVGNGISPLLRRPFAYASYDKETRQASILYERRGKATTDLSLYTKGEQIELIGPLGNSFAQPESKARPILIGGGIGMGPILYFYNELFDQGYDPIMIIGAREAAKIPELPKGAIITSNDGKQGIKGTVIDGLKTLDIEAGAEFYLCGPHPMMHAVYEAYGKDHRVWVSMENTMGCAVGACMGCVVPVHGPKPFARVCAEGPIFNANSIAWKD